MSHFKQLNFPKFDLAKAWLDTTDLTFGREDTPEGQVCINTVKGHEDDPFYGYGGLWKDWQNKKCIAVLYLRVGVCSNIFSSSMASKPITIRWIITDSQQHMKNHV